MFVSEHRAPSLNSVTVPNPVSDANVRGTLLDRFNIEIGGGLGVLKGKIWRIGLMGFSSNQKNVNLVLGALEEVLRGEGFKK